MQNQPRAPSTWEVVILRGKDVDHLGTVEAPDQREAYWLAIEQLGADRAAEPSVCETIAKHVGRTGRWASTADMKPTE
jgi:hypothetical protein